MLRQLVCKEEAVPILASFAHNGYYLLLGLEPHAFLPAIRRMERAGSVRPNCGVVAQDNSG